MHTLKKIFTSLLIIPLLSLLQACTSAPTKLEMDVLLSTQSTLLKKQKTDLLISEEGVTNLYFLGIAADYTQYEMFRETLTAQHIFDRKFATKDRSVVLVNHLSTIKTTPIATHRTIRKTLKNISQKMDIEEDILFLYLTAHGNNNFISGGEVNINFGPEQNMMMNARSLNRYLQSAKIKWKVIVVNSCYSGAFIEDLIDPYTLVITSTNSDNLSYYNPDPMNNFSFFGRAFFEHSLQKGITLSHVFEKTEQETQSIERRYSIPKTKRSHPQFVYGDKIMDKLKELQLN